MTPICQMLIYLCVEVPKHLFPLLIDSIASDSKNVKKKSASKKTAAAEEELNAAKWDLREHVHHLRRLQKELVGKSNF